MLELEMALQLTCAILVAHTIVTFDSIILMASQTRLECLNVRDTQYCILII